MRLVVPPVTLRFMVFGRRVAVRRIENQWIAYHEETDGKLRRAADIVLSSRTTEAELPGALADLCHEWATPTHREVTRLDP